MSLDFIDLSMATGGPPMIYTDVIAHVQCAARVSTQALRTSIPDSGACLPDLGDFKGIERRALLTEQRTHGIAWIYPDPYLFCQVCLVFSSLAYVLISYRRRAY